MQSKKLLFSVTKDEFDWQFFRGSGAGGQKKNKTSSACRCIHRASGAVGESREERSQLHNRRTAFLRCVETPMFKGWLKVQTAAMAQGFANAEKMVEHWMKPEFIKEETF